MQHALLAGREQIAAKAPVLQREQRLSLISLHLTALSAAGDDFTSLQSQQNGMQNAINVTQYRNAVDLLSFPSAAAGKSGNHSELSLSAMKIFLLTRWAHWISLRMCAAGAVVVLTSSVSTSALGSEDYNSQSGTGP